MSKDGYMLHPMLLGPELDLGSSLNIHESVPVSQYGPYLRAAYEASTPSSRTDQHVADTFFEVAAVYSTDESMKDIIFDEQTSAAKKVAAFIPRWLQLTEPLVDSARALDKSVAHHLQPYEKGGIPQRHNNDLNYMMSVFYASTQMASIALDISHPSQTNLDLSRHALNSGRKLIGGYSDEPLPQTNLLIPPFVKAQDIRKVERLKTKAVTLNTRAQKAAERVIAISAAIEGKKELTSLIREQERSA